MGQEIATSRFRKQDFQEFSARLARETEILEAWLREGRFGSGAWVGGFELELWLVDRQGWPAPVNKEYLAQLGEPLAVPELSVFNVELNTPERVLQGTALSQMHADLAGTWGRCARVAESLDVRLAMIGILPSVRETDLTTEHMSDLVRYHALNEQVMRLRAGRPLHLDIRGREVLRTDHQHVMLEAATTSFQIHLQVGPREALRCYNAALILSAPMVSATGNSPFLFGKTLWDETRIPLFEQAVAVGGAGETTAPAYPRVTFGSGYVQTSLFEVFAENRDHYPVLLPMCMQEPEARLCHLRLHNGTIWRWNRPLIGFGRDAQASPHLRIEHRVVPAGPSIPDTIANAALFFGLVRTLATEEAAPERRLPFERLRHDFYAAAREGLQAKMRWLDGNEIVQRQLLLEELLPKARRGLETMGIAAEDRDLYLGIIEERVSSGRTGAEWQRAYVARHGTDMQALTLAYLERQHSGLPVHQWGLTC